MFLFFFFSLYLFPVVIPEFVPLPRSVVIVRVPKEDVFFYNRLPLQRGHITDFPKNFIYTRNYFPIPSFGFRCPREEKTRVSLLVEVSVPSTG